MNYSKLTTMQIDALSEVSNIGAGNAATALSQLLNEKIDMTVPEVNIIPFQKIINEIGSEKEVAGVMVRVLGDCPGNILFVFEQEAALYIIETLTGSSSHGLNELGSSALCEVGNIISSSYMNAISRFTNLVMMPSVPAQQLLMIWLERYCQRALLNRVSMMIMFWILKQNFLMGILKK